ncbi:hypothetical protein Dsin_001849 [Dipteronia sinensis]|uniref:DUF4283 domain-containing protein n=1 Tax=Dipteronia sinensis TaxID=43782 RepID=A0AAE0B5J7_9ROSI|nr:hypothetical protein Dsin_001849 [Dipteronia sinensis]
MAETGDVFIFSARPHEVSIEMVNDKLPNCNISSKRACSVEDGHVENQARFDSLRKKTMNSFKSKLMNMSSPSTWTGFGAKKEKLKIVHGDITVIEGPNRPTMKLSTVLKEQLYKPWANALILKNMGHPHTLNFMLSKLKQKWSLIRYWQLTDLDDGYFISCFQMKEDLDYVLTRGPWVITNEHLDVQKWKPNFVLGEEAIQSVPI